MLKCRVGRAMAKLTIYLLKRENGEKGQAQFFCNVNKKIRTWSLFFYDDQNRLTQRQCYLFQKW
jgi:hypothetical protein